MFGFINIDKPTGVTSRRIVDRMVGRCGNSKVGHAGTLDPLASGVLLVAIGPATRLIRYAQRLPKRYRATFQLGLKSDSEDTERECIPVTIPEIDESALHSCIEGFIGDIEQIPPSYSALKIDGKRAYKLARQGEKVQLKSRLISIYAIELLRFDHPFFEIDIHCGSGTYVRSLGRDIARALGTECVMTELRRTEIGNFSIDSALDLTATLSDGLVREIRKPQEVLSGIPEVVIDSEQTHRLKDGKPIRLDHGWMGHDELYAVNAEGQLIAVLIPGKNECVWKTVINFAPLW